MGLTIYHNPRCSKSRATLALIRDAGIEPEIVDYLTAPPSPAVLADILAKLGKSAEEVTRRKEAREEGIDHLRGAALIEALCAHPRALERPIVISGDRAVLGRPPENVTALL